MKYSCTEKLSKYIFQNDIQVIQAWMKLAKGKKKEVKAYS